MTKMLRKTSRRLVKLIQSSQTPKRGKIMIDMEKKVQEVVWEQEAQEVLEVSKTMNLLFQMQMTYLKISLEEKILLLLSWMKMMYLQVVSMVKDLLKEVRKIEILLEVKDLEVTHLLTLVDSEVALEVGSEEDSVVALEEA